MDIDFLRFEYVKQVGGVPSWIVELVQTWPHPGREGEVHAEKIGPLTPAMAEEQLGQKLSDVIEGINVAVLTECEQLRAELVAERHAHRATTATSQAELERVDQDLMAAGGELAREKAEHATTRDALVAEQEAHAVTKAAAEAAIAG